jgi:MoaA/NifB/PqqE/SkfB family radical SAM enzyme
MRKDIGKIVDTAHELGLETNINTNAYYLPTKIDELKNVSMFSVSLDGDEASHDKNRGKRSFSKAIKGIQVAREHGIKVQVLSVMTKANRNCVDFMINLSKELGFSWVPTSVFLNGGCERTKEMAKSHLLDDEEYRKLLNELLERKKQGEPIVWSSNTLNYVKSWPISYQQQSNFSFDEGKKIQEQSNFKPLTCQAARYFCVIQTNGDLYSCDPQLGFGPKINCIELGFKEAFNRLGTNGCQACNSLVCSELHQLFSMKPGTVANLLKNYGKAG